MEEVFKVELDGLISISQIENAVKKAINQFNNSDNKLAKFNLNDIQEQLKKAPAQLVDFAKALDKTGQTETNLIRLQEKINKQNEKDELERLKKIKQALKLANANKMTAIGMKLATTAIEGFRKALKDFINIAKVASLAVAGVSAVIGGITLLVNKAMDKISGSISRAIKAMPVYRLTRAEFDALEHTEKANSTDGGLAETLRAFNKALNNYQSEGDFATLGLNREKYLSSPSGKDAFMDFLDDVQARLVSLPDSNSYKTTQMESLDSITGGQSDFLKGILKNQFSNGKISEGMLPQIKSDFEEYTKIFNSTDYKKQNEASRLYNKSVSDLTVAFEKLSVAISPVVGNILKAVANLLSSEKVLKAIDKWANKIQKWAETTDFEALFKKAFEFLERLFYIIKWVSDKFGFSGGGNPTALADQLKDVDTKKTPFVAQTRDERDASLKKMTSSFLGSYGKTKPVVNNVNVNINQDLGAKRNKIDSTLNNKPISAGVTIRSK